MTAMRRVQRIAEWTGVAAGLAAAGYVGYVATAWKRYGHVSMPRADEVDPVLDDVMPEYEVAERHSIRVAAPAHVVLATAKGVDLQKPAIVHAIFRARELVLGSRPGDRKRPPGLLAEMQAIGWRVVAEVPDREIVAAAVTQPWRADVVFRGLPTEEFKAFRAPDHVKIAWTLRADAVNANESIFRTETRVLTTDPEARRKFRWYWARFSPGIILIRRVLLRHLKRDAERVYRGGRPQTNRGHAEAEGNTTSA